MSSSDAALAHHIELAAPDAAAAPKKGKGKRVQDAEQNEAKKQRIDQAEPADGAVDMNSSAPIINENKPTDGPEDFFVIPPNDPDVNEYSQDAPVSPAHVTRIMEFLHKNRKLTWKELAERSGLRASDLANFRKSLLPRFVGNILRGLAEIGESTVACIDRCYARVCPDSVQTRTQQSAFVLRRSRSQ
jgi:hypothetical protein